MNGHCGGDEAQAPCRGEALRAKPCGSAVEETALKANIGPMIRLALALILFATSALAQVTVEARSISPTGVTVTLTAEAPIKLMLTDATLVDGHGNALALNGQPRGVKGRTPAGCTEGTVIEGRHIVVLPFAVASPGPYALSMEFETPDPSQVFGCRAFGVSLDRMQ
jgi:hypothetical protein